MAIGKNKDIIAFPTLLVVELLQHNRFRSLFIAIKFLIFSKKGIS